MTRLLTSLAIVLSVEAVVFAEGNPNDIPISSFDPENAISADSSVEGHGVKIGEGTVIHPVVGMETGYVSNVFYTDTAPQGAGILRLLAQISAASASGARLTPTSDSGDANTGDDVAFTYRASLRASYDFMLSGNNEISSTGGLGLGATLRGIANPAGKWSFGFSEDFTRLIRAANYETNANTDRDINSLALNLLYHPTDSTLGGWAYYQNTIDVFERSEQSFADRLQHRIGIHPTWRWLPQTTVFADVQLGFYSGISGSKKVSSFPLTTVAGINTLLSLKTTFNLQAGYTNGFYSNGPSFSAPTVDASLGYRYSPLGRVTLTYDWTYQDSVNANYYRDHTVRLLLQQMVRPFTFDIQPELHFREYQGVDTLLVGAPPTRNDVIFSLVAGVHYNLRDWAAATLDYRFTDVSTDYRYTSGGVTNTNPSYARHEVLLGVRVAL